MPDKILETGTDYKTQADQGKIDQNNEVAGIDIGKIWRFLSNSSPNNFLEEAKKKFEREFDNLLDMLLAEDPIYAALYNSMFQF